MPEGEATSSASDEKAGQGLWSLLPSFDPSVDNAKDYSDKVKFLWGICPAKDRPMLAPRLALLCKGTAWSQVKSIDPTKLTEAEGYKVLLGALSTWEESAELQTYDLFEKAFYKTLQKQDETTMSYVNRINVAFTEVGEDTTVKQVRAFVLLRQSGLSAEDKKRVIAMADGYDPTKMENAMRALSTKVLNQGEVSRKKIYPINYVDEDAEEINQLHDDEPDEDSVMAALLEEGDESAMVIQEFEENIIQVCQDSPELAMAFSAYQDARARLRDKARNRGFWPLRQGGKAKGKSKKGVSKGFGKNPSDAGGAHSELQLSHLRHEGTLAPRMSSKRSSRSCLQMPTCWSRRMATPIPNWSLSFPRTWRSACGRPGRRVHPVLS